MSNIQDLKSFSIFDEVELELWKAERAWPPMNSAHEGYAIIAEELDELWDLVRMNQKHHDFKAMRRECLQIAAMAIRFAKDVCDKGATNE